MRVELQPCYLLHRRSHRETSLLLEVFSAQHGRVALIAKGVLRRTSDSGAHMQPFRSLLLSWTERGGELGTLGRCEAAGPALLREGQALLCGFYLNELILRAVPRHDPHPEIYNDYDKAIHALGRPPAGVEAILRTFEKRLLQGLGYGLILDHDVASGEPIEAEGRYHYQPGQGPIRGEAASMESVPVSGAALMGLANERFADATVLAEAKRLMRALLRIHIGEKPLASRSWFESY
ncbi:MAG: DNA repair protein RecO [Chromatiales bacterium]